MRRPRLIVLLLSAVTLGLGASWAQDAKAPPKVTLNVTDKPAADVAAAISQQTGVQVSIAGKCEAKATLDLKQATLEEAVKALAEAIQASWLRSYLVEQQPPDKPYTGDEIVAMLQAQRDAWFASLTDAERQDTMERWQEAQQLLAELGDNQGYPGAGVSTLTGRFGFGFGGGQGGPGGPGGQGGPGGPGGPGGGAAPPAPAAPAVPAGGPGAAAPAPAPPPAPPGALGPPGGGPGGPAAGGGPGGPGGGPGGPGGGPGGPGGGPGGPGGGPGGPGGGPGGQGGFGGGPLVDPVRQVIIPVRTDQVSLQLAAAQLSKALFEFIASSGFVVAAPQELTGAVTLVAEDKATDDVAAEIAKAVAGKCRRVYVMSVPRQLTQEEVDQRQEAAFQSGMAQFWAQSAEDRAQRVQQWVDMIDRMSQNGANPRMQRMGNRMLGRLGQYSAGLSPGQRAELKPVITALGNALRK
jgi:hypothetical protein